jgi:hypothetical protein
VAAAAVGTVGAASSSASAAPAPQKAPSPSLCYWYDYFYAPVACGFVAFNEPNRIPGYGFSPCAVWQIPLDIVGCALLPRDRNVW